MSLFDSLRSIFTHLFISKKPLRRKFKRKRRAQTPLKINQSRIKKRSSRKKEIFKRGNLKRSLIAKRHVQWHPRIKKNLSSKSFLKKSSPYDRFKVQERNSVKNIILKEEVCIGEITHYFAKIMVCVIKVMHEPLRVGDRVKLSGKITDFEQTVQSLQVESRDVKLARPGQLVGLKVNSVVHPGDKIYRIG